MYTYYSTQTAVLKNLKHRCDMQAQMPAVQTWMWICKSDAVNEKINKIQSLTALVYNTQHALKHVCNSHDS